MNQSVNAEVTPSNNVNNVNGPGNDINLNIQTPKSVPEAEQTPSASETSNRYLVFPK